MNGPCFRQLLQWRDDDSSFVQAPQDQRLPPPRLQLVQQPAEDGDGRRAWVAWVGAAGKQADNAVGLQLCALRVTLPPANAAAQVGRWKSKAQRGDSSLISPAAGVASMSQRDAA